MHSLIIHMSGNAKRAANVEHLLYTLPHAEVAEAVNGRDAVAHRLHPLRKGDFYTPRYPFPLSPGEVGCFLSHRTCWQRIVDEGWDHALIVEDDLSVEPELWQTALSLVETHADVDSFIRLPAKRRETPVASIDQNGAAKLFLPRVIGLQTVAQVVGRNAAANLLAASTTIDRPVDTFLQMHWVHGQRIQTILPNGVSELTEALGGSTIQSKKGGNKLAREFKRALYRAQVAARPQKG
ncbi:glycosyltransferase family 25 protein [Phaeobacter sp. QD34_3]|uniref:glycosyltransferase family 25 protein n=1 Tax=unclassified Phaeobacter TaxID=2621772 RepID=UPI00237F2816|nr:MULTISPECIES: glycosyltransferase family 25 protein [unclassified Phaeobacter]MDE4132389.1 glycosyltransferase family 25 protein [Phaeobacter sp. QD34_3]MDE4136026.1 glycosyltransferase family 25 protein [Phaeobacter sp. QD34_24]